LFPGFRGENGAVVAIVWHLESAESVAIFLLSRSAGTLTIRLALKKCWRARRRKCILAAKGTLLLCALMGV
jgi:hypothetical protein